MNANTKHLRAYEIFRECFPCLKLSAEDFFELTEIDSCQIMTCGGCAENPDEPAGFALTEKNNLRLICVRPDLQKKGFGSRLFSLAQDHIASQGYEHMNIGGSDSRLFIGAVCSSAGFFEKQGCILGEKIAEMCGNTDKLIISDKTEHNVSDNIDFGFYTGSPEALLSAVAAVEDDWVQFFDEEEVFCAFSDKKPVSFCIAEEDVTCLLSDGKSKIGSIGCVGTIPEFRRKGIGLRMVALAAGELKKRGCDKIFIHYTHVYDWYSKLGFETFLWVRLGGKQISGEAKA